MFFQVHILFEETYYTESSDSFKVLCIDRMLEGGSGKQCYLFLKCIYETLKAGPHGYTLQFSTTLLGISPNNDQDGLGQPEKMLKSISSYYQFGHRLSL